MRAVRVRVAVLLLAGSLLGAGCGVRTPAPIDVAALVAKRGEVEARQELAIRVLDDPRDVQARLALAELADRTGRPSEAIEQLEAVVRLGGPLGTRWHDADRARLARLLLARGRARLARGSATALADLDRARSFGAAPTAAELEQARLAIAFAQLRHVAAKERAKGRATLAAFASEHPATAGKREAAWARARDGAATDAKTEGAGAKARDAATVPEKREAAWAGARDGATPAQRGAFGAWLWTIGARREAWDQLAAWHDATRPPRDEALQSAYLRALAWWSPIWLGEAKPPPAEDLVGPERCWFPGADCEPPVTDETPTGDTAPEPPVGTLGAEPRVAVAARYAAARSGVDVARLVPIARAFYRDAAVAERLGRDVVASSVDAAAAHAALGALFDAVGDPARARAAWQAAVDASPEPPFVRALAEATGRAGDGAAAIVFATQAAAAWGDPAVVWTSVARALVDGNQHVDALTAARSAIDLAGPDVLPQALDVAIAASRVLGRTAQADALRVQRAQLAPRGRAGDADAQAALAAHREQPTASTVAALWVASRAHPRSVELRAALSDALDADDPRAATVAAELFALAGDSDPDRALAAVAALRRR